MGKDGRTLVPQTKMRAAIGRAMSKSKSSAPHFYVVTDITMNPLLDALAAHNNGRERGDRVSVTAALVKATALALVEEPGFNAHWTDEGHELIADVNVGVAIALDGGLIAPALLDCGDRGVDDVAAGLRDLVSRSREGKLRGQEMMSATFTVSNLGMYDVTAFTAIVTPPQVAILATGRIVEMPRFENGEVVSRSLMTATLSADHRAVDGADAARFLGTLKRFVEEADPIFAAAE